MYQQPLIIYNYLLREEFIDEDGIIYNKGKYVALHQPVNLSVENVNFYLFEFYNNQTHTYTL